ncbi:MAG: hypothetical protein ACI4V5_06630 [Prevotella sp.]
MKKTIMYLLLCTTLCLGSNSVFAQNTASEVLNSLTFETPKALYHVKGNTANVRKQPSTKAAKFQTEGGWEYILRKGIVVEDKGNNPQWVTTTIDGKTAYINKSVMVKCDNTPISPSVYNQYYSYTGPNFGCEEDPNDFMDWRVAPIKGNSGLYVCIYSDGFSRFMMLGKMVDNVLVFKYKVHMYSNDTYSDEELAPLGKYKIEFVKESNMDGKSLWFIPNKSMLIPLNMKYRDEPIKYLDLTKLTEKMVYVIFKEKIEKGKTEYFYLPAWSFSSAFDFNTPI